MTLRLTNQCSVNPVGSICGFSMPVTNGARQTYIWIFDRLTVARCSVSNQQFINWSVMAESLFALLSEFEIGDWSGQLLLKKVWSGRTRLLHSAPGDIYFWPQWSARLVTRLSVRQYFDHGIGCLATSSPAKVFSVIIPGQSRIVIKLILLLCECRELGKNLGKRISC